MPRKLNDVVYILRPDIESTELVYSLRSIEKNFPHHGAVAFGHYGKALYNLFTYLGICPCDIGYNKPAGDRYPKENPFN